MAQPFEITEHAIDRYIARHDRTLAAHDRGDRQKARAVLAAAMEHGCRIKERTFTGDAMWQAPDVDVILVVKEHDRGRLVVVTVLPADAYMRSRGGRPRFMSDEEAELMHDAASRGPSLLDTIEAREAGMSVEAWLARKAGVQLKGAA